MDYGPIEKGVELLVEKMDLSILLGPLLGVTVYVAAFVALFAWIRTFLPSRRHDEEMMSSLKLANQFDRKNATAEERRAADELRKKAAELTLNRLEAREILNEGLALVLNRVKLTLALVLSALFVSSAGAYLGFVSPTVVQLLAVFCLPMVIVGDLIRTTRHSKRDIRQRRADESAGERLDQHITDEDSPSGDAAEGSGR